MAYMTNIEQVLKHQRYVPVVTFAETDDVGRFADFLLDQGVSCIEVTLRTPFAMQAIRNLKNAYGDRLVIGAGTVTRVHQIVELKEIGVDFVVSPGLIKELFEAASKVSTPFLPGVATPTEIMNARAWGIKWLKFFPANVNGGAIALKAYASVFPDVRFCPTGGISKDSSSDYLDLPNVFAVGGSWFQKEFPSK
jgi:2-dehydro-3-deoxyphosphogluconate aldolase / (4S)-4-hydroxy-2-oxoglutarate aldolase